TDYCTLWCYIGVSTIWMLHIPMRSSMLGFCPFPHITICIKIASASLSNKFWITLLFRWNICMISTRWQIVDRVFEAWVRNRGGRVACTPTATACGHQRPCFQDQRVGHLCDNYSPVSCDR